MTNEIQKAVCTQEVLKFNLVCENVSYLFTMGECDVLSLYKSGYIAEFEVKISRSDFLADAKKRKFQYYGKSDNTPNYLSYVCPTGLIEPNEIPSFAGLTYYDTETNELTVIKKPKMMHKKKHCTEKVLSKFMRLSSERQYLGSARMTYENNLIKEQNERYITNSL